MRLSVVQVGPHVVVQSPVTGCLIVTNAVGETIGRGLIEGCTKDEISADVERTFDLPPDLARSLTDQVLVSWDDAGLFDEAVPQWAAMSKGNAEADLCLRLSIGDTVVCLKTNCPVLFAQLSELLKRLIDDGARSASAEVEALRIGDDYGVWENGQPVWTLGNLEQARFLSARSVAVLLHGRDRVGVVLHAGAISDGAQCLVFTAESGGGKTTLVASLVASGFQYVSDDQVPVAASGAHVLPFPTAVSVKPGSLTLPELSDLIAETRAPGASPREGVTFLHPPFAWPTAEPIPVRAVVLPTFDANGPNEITRLSFEDAMRAVLLAGAEVMLEADRVRAFATLLAERPVVRLRYNTTAFAVSACRDLLACKPI